jgi:hypothetical protein
MTTIRKTRFIEPGNYSPYKKSAANMLVYNKYIRNPSTGLITLATIVRNIIDSGIAYNFSVQARFETGFDDEVLDLMKKAGFVELALGIEFLDDDSFREFNKKSTYQDRGSHWIRKMPDLFGNPVRICQNHSPPFHCFLYSEGDIFSCFLKV